MNNILKMIYMELIGEVGAIPLQSPSACGRALLRGHAGSSREGFDGDSTEGAKDFRCRFIRSGFALF